MRVCGRWAVAVRAGRAPSEQRGTLRTAAGQAADSQHSGAARRQQHSTAQHSTAREQRSRRRGTNPRRGGVGCGESRLTTGQIVGAASASPSVRASACLACSCCVCRPPLCFLCCGPRWRRPLLRSSAGAPRPATEAARKSAVCLTVMQGETTPTRESDGTVPLRDADSARGRPVPVGQRRGPKSESAQTRRSDPTRGPRNRR